MDVDFQNLSIDDREEEEGHYYLLGDPFRGRLSSLGLGIVKVDDLPSGFVSRSLEKSLGDLMGTYLKYYTSGKQNFMNNFMRLRRKQLSSAYQRQRLLMLGRKRLGWSEASTSDNMQIHIASLIGSKNCVENNYLFVPKLGKFQMPKGSCMQNVTGIDGREDELLEVGEAKNVPVVRCRVLSHPEQQTFRHSSNLR
ncbi:hypothetical protein Gotri_012514 [Gossypium trilobum]|uniref:Uncharacterized protein n=1 Tax=Gossypium trilobum TaxID=34281 RepID=A0A7J9DQH7_9ROSI|nr:hypothetical protein [Gossypium trilobum]